MGEKAKKEKKAKKEAAVEEEAAPAAAPAGDRKAYLAPIAKPLADDKLSKKVGATATQCRWLPQLKFDKMAQRALLSPPRGTRHAAQSSLCVRCALVRRC